MNHERFGGTNPDQIIIPKGYLTAPDEYGPLHDIAINVPSLNDSWLVSRERNLEEVHKVIEGRLQGIQLVLQSPENNILKTRWNIDGPVSGALSRTIAYAEMLDEYRVHQEAEIQKLNGLEIEFQNRLEELRLREEQKQISRQERTQQTTKERKETDTSKYLFGISFERDKQVRKVIVTKALSDYLNYSQPTENSLINLQGLFEGLERYGKVDEHNSYSNHAMSHLVNSMTDSLRNPNGQMYRRLRYKPTLSPIKTFVEAAQLQQFMTMRFEPANISRESDIHGVLRSFSQAYFEFHQSRALIASKHTSEYVPFLSLIYDIATLASTSGNISLIEQVRSYLDREFISNLNTKTVKREMEIVSADIIRDIEEFFSPKTKSTDSMSEDVTTIKQEELELLTELIHRDSWTIGTGLLTLETASKVQGSSTGWEGLRLVDPLRAIYQREDKRMHARLNKRYNNIQLARAAIAFATMPFQLAEESTDLELNLLTAIPRLDKYYHSLVISNSQGQKELQRRLDDQWGRGKDVHLPKSKRLSNFYKKTIELESMNKRGVAELIREYASLYWDTPQTEEEQSEEQERHERLWGEILDNSEWFVSPRGDRFLAKDDPEMKTRGIESLTFRIDKERPREHKVEILIEGLPHMVTLLLDTQRNMLFDTHPFTQERSRSPLLIDQRAKLQFGNFILKRLYAITSGVYKQDQEGGRSDYVGNEPEIYRRACYLKYGPGFHLTSESALQHKREIKEEYNIDLDVEQRRRREIGTLSHNEKLSFRRETIPVRFQGTFIPNILVYDPHRIII